MIRLFVLISSISDFWIDFLWVVGFPPFFVSIYVEDRVKITPEDKALECYQLLFQKWKNQSKENHEIIILEGGPNLILKRGPDPQADLVRGGPNPREDQIRCYTGSIRENWGK